MGTATVVIIVLLIAISAFLLFHYFNQSELIKNLKKMIETLETYALVDPLTGLNNRRNLKINTSNIMREAVRKNVISFIFFDIDHFKKFNDNFGHHVGDECLKMVAIALSKLLRRSSDLFIRWGGEEFVVILPAAEADLAQKLAEKMRAEVEALENLPEGVTISLGILTVTGLTHEAMMKLNAEDIKKIIDTMINKADKLMYEAKNGGRNQAVSDEVSFEGILVDAKILIETLV